MQTNDLLEAATLACKSFWEGSDKSKLSLRECMTDLQVAVRLEQQKRAKEDTTRLEKK